MALNLELIKQHATIYGDALYTETVNYGQVSPGEYEFIEEYNSLRIDLGDGTFISARIKQSVVDAGIDPTTQVFTVAKFTAKRDAAGVIDGREWSVSKGDMKDFAY
jgi:hypothetical protein